MEHRELLAQAVTSTEMTKAIAYIKAVCEEANKAEYPYRKVLDMCPFNRDTDYDLIDLGVGYFTFTLVCKDSDDKASKISVSTGVDVFIYDCIAVSFDLKSGNTNLYPALNVKGFDTTLYDTVAPDLYAFITEGSTVMHSADKQIANNVIIKAVDRGNMTALIETGETVPFSDLYPSIRSYKESAE